MRRAPGAPVDNETRERLRVYLSRAHWRPACAAIGCGAAVLRRALAGDRIRTASACAIRLALDLVDSLREPTP